MPDWELSGERRSHILGVLLCALGALTAFSLLTYHSSDWPHELGTGYRNACGPAGALSSFVLNLVLSEVGFSLVAEGLTGALRVPLRLGMGLASRFAPASAGLRGRGAVSAVRAPRKEAPSRAALADPEAEEDEREGIETPPPSRRPAPQ